MKTSKILGKLKMIVSIFLLLVVIFIPEQVSAQQNDYDWLWAVRGGGKRDMAPNNGNSFSFDNSQKVRHIAIDKDNNYYFIADVGSETTPGSEPTFGNIPNDTIPIATYNESNGMLSSYNARDTYLVSTTCDGTFRWQKTIGGGGQIFANGLATDEEGGVYIAGYILQPPSATVPIHYDQDSIKTSVNLDKHVYLMKYDTQGNFQWLKEPQPDPTDPTWGAVSGGELEVEDDGTIHWRITLDPGASFENGSIIAEDHYFAPLNMQVGDTGVVRYDKNGTFLGYTRFDAKGFLHFGWVQSSRTRFAYDPSNNRYYMVARGWAGSSPVHPIIINGVELTGAYYIAAFDATDGSSIWWHEYSANSGGTWLRISDVALDDQGNVYLTGTFRGAMFNDPDHSFAGYVFSNLLSEPYCMKLDSNGQHVWTSMPDGAARAPDRVIVSGDEVFLGQGYVSFGGGGHYWDNAYFERPSGHGTDPVVIRLDKTTGEGIEIHDIMSSGFGHDDVITALEVDKLGNIVVGGYMQSDWLFDAHTTVPRMYKKNGNDHDFFLAQLAKDGVNCSDFLSNGEAMTLPKVELWPNPTTGRIQLKSTEGFENIKVFDVLGRLALPNNSLTKNQKSISLDLNSLPAGVYFIQVSMDGQWQTFKVIKK